MLYNIQQSQGEESAMELLDTLRALRQTHPGLRMIYTGSIGLHHVLGALKEAGYINPSTNDMKTIELPPLDQPDACALAMALISGEAIQCDDVAAVTAAIATESACVPYYIHHIVDALATGRQQANVKLIGELVAAKLRDPQDPWEFQHFFDRIPRYYGKASAKLACQILDCLAVEGNALSLDVLFERLKAQAKLDDPEPVRSLLRLLQRDHYVLQDEKGAFAFRLALIQRAWKTQRAL
jgi:hypothetical protein